MWLQDGAWWCNMVHVFHMFLYYQRAYLYLLKGMCRHIHIVPSHFPAQLLNVRSGSKNMKPWLHLETTSGNWSASSSQWHGVRAWVNAWGEPGCKFQFGAVKHYHQVTMVYSTLTVQIRPFRMVMVTEGIVEYRPTMGRGTSKTAPPFTTGVCEGVGCPPTVWCFEVCSQQWTGNAHGSGMGSHLPESLFPEVNRGASQIPTLQLDNENENQVTFW